MRQARKWRKIFLARIPLILDPGKKIPKKIAKNSKNLKNLFPALFLAKTGSDRPRKGEKNFSPEFRSYLTPERKFRNKISKKIQKNKKLHSSIIFSQNGMRLCEKGRKKILVPNSAHTRPRKENSEKKLAKKFKKLKNFFPALFLARTG